MSTPPQRTCRSGKVSYSKKDALTAKNRREAEGSERLRLYECPWCGCWHLTHTQLPS